MTLNRNSILTVGLLTALGVFSGFSPLATAQDTPKAEKREGDPAGPKGPPLERKDNLEGKANRNAPLPEGAAPRRGPQDDPDVGRFRPGRPLPGAVPAQGPRRDPNDPNPNEFDGRPDGNRRPVRSGGGLGGPGGPVRSVPNELEQMKEADPEMYELVHADMKLDHQTREEAEEYRRAKPAEKEAIKAKLTKSVEEHYSVRQKRRELDLRRLEEQLTRLRDSVKRRNDEKDLMIKQRVAQLVGNPDDGF